MMKLSMNQQEDISSNNFYCIVNNGNVLVKTAPRNYVIYSSYENALNNIKILGWLPCLKSTPELEQLYIHFLNELFCE